MLKPPVLHLRLMNHIVSGYIDDLYLKRSTYQKYTIKVLDSIQMLDSLMLVIHPEKSVFIPLQKIVFLVFVIDSVRMIVMLTEDKIHKLKDLLTFIIHKAHSFSGFGTLLDLLAI